MMRSCFTVIIIPCLLMIAVAAGANVIIDGSLTHELTVRPGGSYEGEISFRNTESKPQEVRAYQTDYLFYADGRVVYGETGSAPRSSADWITFSPQRVLVPAQGTETVHYRIEVPNDQTLGGTYWSLLMIEGVPTSTEAPDDSAETGVQMGHRFRYGLQIVTEVGDKGAGQLRFLNARLQIEGELQAMEIDLGNEGDRWMRTAVSVELYGQEGNLVGVFSGERKRLYPSTSASFQIDLSEVAAGSYQALVIADSGRDDVVGAVYTVLLKE